MTMVTFIHVLLSALELLLTAFIEFCLYFEIFSIAHCKIILLLSIGFHINSDYIGFSIEFLLNILFLPKAVIRASKMVIFIPITLFYSNFFINAFNV